MIRSWLCKIEWRRLSQTFNKLEIEIDQINKQTVEQYLQWYDKSVAGRLFKPVDPEHVNIAGCKSSTFMGFFEGIITKLISYERETNPIGKTGDIKSSDKEEDEEFMKKTADYNEPEPSSPKRLRTDSFSKEDDMKLGARGSTSIERRNSSPNKVKRFKKMTDDVVSNNVRN